MTGFRMIRILRACLFMVVSVWACSPGPGGHTHAAAVSPGDTAHTTRKAAAAKPDTLAAQLPDIHINTAHIPGTEMWYALADSVIHSGYFRNRLTPEFDDSAKPLLVAEDHFTDSRSKSIMVLLSGSGTVGSSCFNFMMLFDGEKNGRLIAADITGAFSASDIKDLNHDGVKEIISRCGMMRMGACEDIYSITNYKGGQYHELYHTTSESEIDCGNDESVLADFRTKGDTLENSYAQTLQTTDSLAYTIKQTQTIKIHNGGKTGKDVLRKMKIVKKTDIIKL